MTNKEERAIIFRAVWEAIRKGFSDRTNVAREASLISDRRGVNPARAYYLQAILTEALDKKEREGLVC